MRFTSELVKTAQLFVNLVVVMIHIGLIIASHFTGGLILRARRMQHGKDKDVANRIFASTRSRQKLCGILRTVAVGTDIPAESLRGRALPELP